MRREKTKVGYVICLVSLSYRCKPNPNSTSNIPCCLLMLQLYFICKLSCIYMKIILELKQY